jgi:hypothetical protein
LGLFLMMRVQGDYCAAQPPSVNRDVPVTIEDTPMHAGLAGLDHIVERLHRFFYGRAVVPAVDLAESHMVGAEAAQARGAS